MVVDALQNYVTLVNGLTRTTREKALAAARAMLAQAGLDDVANDAQERVAKLAEEILVASKANRELLDTLIATMALAILPLFKWKLSSRLVGNEGERSSRSRSAWCALVRVGGASPPLNVRFNIRDWVCSCIAYRMAADRWCAHLVHASGILKLEPGRFRWNNTAPFFETDVSPVARFGNHDADVIKHYNDVAGGSFDTLDLEDDFAVGEVMEFIDTNGTF